MQQPDAESHDDAVRMWSVTTHGRDDKTRWFGSANEATDAVDWSWPMVSMEVHHLDTEDAQTLWEGLGKQLWKKAGLGAK